MRLNVTPALSSMVPYISYSGYENAIPLLAVNARGVIDTCPGNAHVELRCINTGHA
jgi:hypothetical protein